MSVNFKRLIKILGCLSLLTACTSTPEPIPSANNKHDSVAKAPEMLILSDFKYIKETYSPGNSGHVASEALVFSYNNKNIALVHRSGLVGRSMVNGKDGIEIKDGQPLNFSISTVNKENQVDTPKCILEFGGQFCEVFMEGKCLSVCKGKLSIKVLDSEGLEECLKTEEDPIIANLLKKGTNIYDLDLKSPCVFFNGHSLLLESHSLE